MDRQKFHYGDYVTSTEDSSKDVVWKVIMWIPNHKKYLCKNRYGWVTGISEGFLTIKIMK